MQLKKILAVLAATSTIAIAPAAHCSETDPVPVEASAQVFTRFQYRDGKGVIQTGQAIVDIPVTVENQRDWRFKQNEPIAVWTAVAKLLGKKVTLRPNSLATLEKEGLVLIDYKIVAMTPPWMGRAPNILTFTPPALN